MTLVSGHSVSTVPSAAGGRCIKQSDGHRKKRLPLAFCVTPGEDESVAEGASARGQQASPADHTWRVAWPPY